MKLFKVEIVTYPAGSWEESGDWSWPTPDWAPDGWLADDDERAAWLARHHDDDRFFWPSTKRLYQSRSGAQARAALVESYGATVEIVESAPIVWLTADVRRALRIEALEAELAALREAS